MRRRATPQRAKTPNRAKSNGEPVPGITGALDTRVASLEEQLWQLNQETQPRSHDDGWQHAAVTASGSSVSISNSDWGLGNVSGTGTDSPTTLPMLPSLDEIIPTVEQFFEQINPFIPLFDKACYFRMLMDWYTALPSGVAPSCPNGNKTGSPRAIFAAINVVLALSPQMPHASQQETPLTREDPKVEKCMRNIEHVLSHLISGDEELLNLQVLLGLILLRLGCKDPQPATILIGSAVQLCQRLFLSDPGENEKHPTESRLQRERVFWVTYVLDKVRL